jgi:ankyrin repeat protein
MASTSPTHCAEEHMKAANQHATRENVELAKAVLAGSPDEVARWLRNGANPDFFFRPEDQKNALHLACEHGHTDIMATLLAHGADVNCLSAPTQSTPLHFAAACDNPAGVEVLLKAGADMARGK